MVDAIYLDDHTATSCSNEVLDLFSRLSKEYWGSLESYHYIGQKGLYSLQKSVEQLFTLMGAEDTDHLFCLPVEEALTRISLHVYTHLAKQTGKTGVLTLPFADRSVRQMGELMTELGCTYRELTCNQKGQLTPELVEAAITSRTALVSLSWSDPLTGVIHPIEEIARVCREKEVLLHVDATYIWGKRFFRLQDLPLDFLTLDVGLIGGIPRTGLLWVRQGALHDFNETIPSIAEISSTVLSVEERQNKFEHYCLEVARLRDLLEEGLLKECKGAKVLFKDLDRLPNCTVISFPGIHYESLSYLLHTKGVYTSFGGGKFPKLEDQLASLGIEEAIAKSSLSFSLPSDISEEAVEKAIGQIVESVQHLQKYCDGGVWKEI